MPTDLTDAATWADVTAVPQDGDAASTDTGDGPLTPVLQKLANRDAYLAEYLNGLILGRLVVRSNGATVTVTGPARCWLGRRGLATAIGTLTYTCSGLSSGTWYYLYVYASSGVLALETSTTAPDADRMFKTGDATRRYVGCFRATGATSCRPFRAVGGSVRYSRGEGSVVFDDFRVLASGTATTWTAVSLTGFVPPHAQRYHLDAQFEPRTTNVDTLELQESGETGVAFALAAQGVAANSRIPCPVEVNRVGASQAVNYRVGHSGAKASLWVAGFEE